MKKDRNCGTPYPVYQGMGMPMMPNMFPVQNMMMPGVGMNNYPNTVGMNTAGMNNYSTATNSLEQQINNFEQRISNLEKKVSTLENLYNNTGTYNNNYNSSNYQML